MRRPPSSRVAFAFLLLVLLAAESRGDVGATTHDDLQLGPARDILAVDLDGDHDEDLVVVRADDNGSPLGIFLQDQGAFTDVTPTAIPASLPGPGSFAAAGDFEKDDDPDIVYCPNGPQNCLVLANQHGQTGRVGFSDLTPTLGITAGAGPWLPLLVDYDTDGDADLLLFPRSAGRLGRVVRNDSRDGAVRFKTLPPGSLPTAGPVRDVAVIDALGKGKLLYVSRVGPDRILEATGLAFADTSARHGLTPSPTPPGSVAVGDFDGDGTRDLVVHRGQAGPTMLVQGAGGVFRDATSEVTGLGGPTTLQPQVVARDFDRDGRDDLFVSGSFLGPAQLLLNGGGAAGTLVRFADATTLAGIAPVGFPTAAATFLRPRACDWGIGLVLASGLGTTPSPSRIHGFPDDSARHTVPVDRDGFGRAAEAGSCVEGSPGPDRLVGHRVASILRGGDGRDELIATAGVTLMEGGQGPDSFDAAGVTLIRMPPEDVAAGESVDCQRADEVRIDSTLTLDELIAAGVSFNECFELGDCEQEPAHLEEGEEPAGDEDEAHCHPPPPVLNIANYGYAEGVGGVGEGLDLGFAPTYGSGYGSCEVDADCYGIGLDFCRTAAGSPPGPGGMGQCYPSTEDGFGGPVAEWCRDPFWARYRFDELQQEFEADGSAIIVPIIFWLPRSNAVTDEGVCTIADQADPGLSIAGWYESIATAVNGSNGVFSKWGVYIDWQLRTFTISTNSPFIADPATDACQVELEFVGDEPNSVGKLVDAHPFAYRSCELNVYLSDNGNGGVAFSNSIKNDTDTISFIILKSTAGALSHEVGHKLGLPHPFSNNIYASGQEPTKSESRDSWAVRPFPDDVDRLHTCSLDADCSGVDAEPGICLKAPFAILGYCQNLKADCAYDGDHICDTPWDSLPCFQGISSLEGDACSTNDDCHATSTFRGTSYLTECGPGNLCRKIDCTSNTDCDADSYCAGGSCVITKSSSTACCDMHTDRTLGMSHSACWEREAGGDVVPVPGVGDFEVWPYDDNVMGYHKPRGRLKSLTPGQRDYSVCRTSYRSDWGEIIRGQRAAGEPCSTRSGDGIFSHANVRVNAVVAHGACASGVCQITDTGALTEAVCVPSTCADGLVGPDEAATDCGGVCGVPCSTKLASSPKTATCRDDADCVSSRCVFGVCQPTCEDGQHNGSELAVDSGGVGWDSTCSSQSLGELCRFDEECGGATICEGEQACVTSGECPINDDPMPCLSNAECPASGGKCKVLKGLCAASSCFVDAECPDSFCQLPDGHCACTADANCPDEADSCVPSQTMCTGQCVDGRCLGFCEQQIVLP